MLKAFAFFDGQQMEYNVSYFPAVSGSATNLDEFAPLVLELTIIIRKLIKLRKFPILPIFNQKNKISGKKIAQIGNYCQLKATCCKSLSIRLTGVILRGRVENDGMIKRKDAELQ